MLNLDPIRQMFQKLRKGSCVFLTATFLSFIGHAQTDQQKNEVEEIRTANDLATGNARDVMVSFFQLAYEDLRSDKKEFEFTSNVFALMLRRNENLNLDTYFVKNYFTRNSNFSLSFKLDSNEHFDGFKLAYKYAIVNRRDYAVSRRFIAKAYQNNQGTAKAVKEISAAIGKKYNEADSVVKRALIDEINNFCSEGTINYNDLSPEAKKFVDRYFGTARLQLDPDWNPKEDAQKIYDELVDSYKTKLLWTASADFNTNYGDTEKGGFNLRTEAVGGLASNARASLEYLVKADYILSDDSLTVENDMDRKVVGTEASLNIVVRNKVSKPWLEFALGINYNVTLGGLYENEEKKRFLGDCTVRVRLTQEIWIPVELKYDPDNGKFFGMISVKANFDGLKKAFGSI